MSMMEVFQDNLVSTLQLTPTTHCPDDMIELLLKHHLILKVKPMMDQFIEGLSNLQVHHYVKKFPEVMKRFFVNQAALTSGKYNVLRGSHI